MSEQKYHQALTANRKLLAENSRLKAEVERLRASSFVTAVPVEEYDKLKAEVERLQKLVGMQENIDKAIDAWIESKTAAKEGRPNE